ncbi:pyridoxal-phosphate dependent enzyme [Microbacterium sp. 2FI]|uniref:pyridoxal-phosphate dependent enzyme n=1 Tax=Microbacterium sp. 2FI TaxID=2502193 RepID=UPI0010F4C8F7|nr:pyridoxal-phosphate dependent enzyme [Microbacterium sp. 2FI]
MDDIGTTVYRNPAAREWRTTPAPDVLEFHRSLPGYVPTRLVPSPDLARELGVATVHVKEESSRLGLPAFKILGASYAISRALGARYGAPEAALPIADLRALIARHDAIELVAATDGNHGRAVARIARLLGLDSRIFVPSGITRASKEGIASEGAALIELDESYDDVVTRAAGLARSAEQATMLIQDTSWDDYRQIPEWIVDGYSTLLLEADQQLRAVGVNRIDAVAVPVGVGSLAQAVVRHYRSTDSAPTVLSVEPEAAPALIASLHAGRPLVVPTRKTIMAGLNCGTVTDLGWPTLKAGIDAAVVVTDTAAARAVHDLESLGIDAGSCGAASLAGLRALIATEPLPANAHVLLLSTESRTANPLPKGM